MAGSNIVGIAPVSYPCFMFALARVEESLSEIGVVAQEDEVTILVSMEPIIGIAGTMGVLAGSCDVSCFYVTAQRGLAFPVINTNQYTGLIPLDCGREEVRAIMQATFTRLYLSLSRRRNQERATKMNFRFLPLAELHDPTTDEYYNVRQSDFLAIVDKFAGKTEADAND